MENGSLRTMRSDATTVQPLSRLDALGAVSSRIPEEIPIPFHISQAGEIFIDEVLHSNSQKSKKPKKPKNKRNIIQKQPQSEGGIGLYILIRTLVKISIKLKMLTIKFIGSGNYAKR